MLTEDFQFLHQVVQTAGETILQYFGKNLALSHKSTSADYCTKADVASEQIIVEGIEKAFPTYNIYAEERGKIEKGSPYTFVIDPLDGTNNFVLGVPVFTISVALMCEGQTCHGVVYSPFTKDLYCATKGQGAFLNGNPIWVNQENQARNMTLAYFCNYITSFERMKDFRDGLLHLGIRRYLDLWAPAFSYCLLASGKLEGIVNDRIELYDYAAGKLIAMEAGAKVTDFSGKPLLDDTVDKFVVTNGTSIHSVIVNQVTSKFYEALIPEGEVVLS